MFASPLDMFQKSRQRGFTLIELLVVMVIILILAGIVLGLVKYAQEKASRAKAEGELSAIAAALENYKSDNGAYPSAASTDSLDAKMSVNPGTDGYKPASAVLYSAITGDPGGSGNVAFGKTYYNIPKSEQATIAASGSTPGYTYINDPFGNSFGYSTAYQADLIATPTATPMRGYNPTYDLWSTGGYGGSGRSYPSDSAMSSATAKSALWIKNW